MLWNDTVPQIEIKDINGKKTIIDIVAGKVSDIAAPSPAPDSWASEPSNEVSILHFMMEENAIFEISGVSAKTNRSLYFFEGTSVKINDFVYESENALELDASEKIVIQNGGKPGRFLLLQGKPIGEPVVQYGPFVMNSKEEIQQAFLDYQKTRFGGWPWKKSDQVHDKTRGRFALYDTGEEIIKD